MTYRSLKEWNLAQIQEIHSPLNILGTSQEYNCNVMERFDHKDLLSDHYMRYGGPESFNDNNRLVIDGVVVKGNESESSVAA